MHYLRYSRVAGGLVVALIVTAGLACPWADAYVSVPCSEATCCPGPGDIAQESCDPYYIPPDGVDVCLQDCRRYDGTIQTTDDGEPDVVMGSSGVCANCPCCCPSCSPDKKTCSFTLGVSYTETVTVNVAAGVQVGADVIEANLEQSIGHSNQRELSQQVSVEVEAGACKERKEVLKLDVTTGIGTRQLHTYEGKACICGDLTGCPDPQWVDFACAQSRESTASGSCWGNWYAATEWYRGCP